MVYLFSSLHTPLIILKSMHNIIMMISSTTNKCLVCIFVLSFFLHCCSSKDNITTGETINGINYLESPAKKFQMGFFSPDNSNQESVRWYVGIWYAMDPKTVVWVANRNKPMPDSTGVLKIEEDGELKVLDNKDQVYFKTTGGGGGATRKALRLLDSGNAILVDIDSGYRHWESFLYPTDTFLPGMKMDLNLNLTSWKNSNDPSSGSFCFRMLEANQYFIRNTNKDKYQWKSGSGSFKSFEPEQLFIGAYYLLSNSTKPPYETNYCNRIQEKNYCNDFANSAANFMNTNNSRLFMSHTGNIQYFTWQEHEWHLVWQVPKDYCNIYEVCGVFSVCTLSNDTFNCSCLPGFEQLHHSEGCKRINELSCTNDEFVNKMINLENPVEPDVVYDNELDCKNRCLQSCECRAYSYIQVNSEQVRTGRSEGINNSCWIWRSDLNNIQANGRHNISIRVNRQDKMINEVKGSPHENSSSLRKEAHILIFILLILLILLIGSLGYIYYRKSVTHQQGINSASRTENSERWATELLDLDQSREDDTESIGVPFFQLETILAATDNFSEANKLGRGGFGPVYKGKLPGGKEVAVKRLSSVSFQGFEEFRNEVMLIAKLQHRNLVRLLGYCVKGNEKILVYEYMSNKSLDAFIFDGESRISLDWAKRFDIIMGIARGLLYLHQDSRLRIIHRDLKTSNILLDEELNPKISDFGLAKIVQGREMEATTDRVVGTYGYMAPEYALEGFFSIKSDVFSFGVVVLEIISGQKNNMGTTRLRQNLSLLGHAWNLWKEDMPFELMDQRLVESSNPIEVLKCIIVGLLCVQEDPGDRPSMTNVVLMLAGDITSLPNPKQPAFVARKTMSISSSSSYKPDQTITMTLPEGR